MHPETVSIQILRKAFSDKNSRNSGYSMRAFARDLGVSPAYVCQIFKGKRGLSLQTAVNICQVLELSASDRAHFLKTVIVTPQRELEASKILKDVIHFQDQSHNYFESYGRVEEDKFKFIADWYHLAILDLTAIKNFKSNTKFVAASLGLSLIVTQDAVDRLFRLGLLVTHSGVWKKAQENLNFVNSAPKASFRSFHDQMLTKAKEELSRQTEEDYQRRMITGITFAVNSSRIEEAKREIEAFKKRMADLLIPGPSDQVYQLNVQLFPLTKKAETI